MRATTRESKSFLPTFCNAVLPVLLEYRVRARGDGDASGGSRKVASTWWGEVTSEGMNGCDARRCHLLRGVVLGVGGRERGDD